MKYDDFVCSKPDCTFAITGTCFESVSDPTRNCPHLRAKEPESPAGTHGEPIDESEAPSDSVRQFPPGLELGLHDITRLMRSRYVKLIGVLGQVEAGKTCLFTSMYLQLTGRYLCPKYRFVMSETLLGFEQRARHLRDWSKGGVPDQIVDHTQLGHSRSPSFLHLAISDDEGCRHDLLFPDLPGEWTTRLLSEASASTRFGFLSRSDSILIVLEAPSFSNTRTRHNAITDATHLLARLANDIRLPRSIPIILAVTKCDETDGKIPTELNRVADVADGYGFSVTTVALAAFPTDPARIRVGFGIDRLLAHLTSPPVVHEEASGKSVDDADRSYLKAGG